MFNMPNSRAKASKLLDLIDVGLFDARKLLEDVLINYMTSDDANDFADTYLDEYGENDDDDE